MGNTGCPIRCGVARPVEDVARQALTCFCKAHREISSDIPFAKLIESADDPAEFDRICGDINGGGTVKDFLRQAAAETTDRRSMMRRYIVLAFENCIYDIPHRAKRIDTETSISEARQALKAAQN